MSNPGQSDIATIRRGLGILVAPGSVVELRVPNIPGRGIVSGYFNDPGKLTQSAAGLSGKGEGVYLTLNPVKPELLARANNRTRDFARHTTSDGDIVRRCWLFIDFDPARRAGISATDAEHYAALERARRCRDWLRAEGWPEPVLADSGNGAHLLYRVELPNDDQSSDLLRRCLEAIAFQLSDQTVEVDLKTYNSARLVKVYGTLAAKGDSVPQRPHRLSQLLEVPPASEPVPLELLEALGRRVPKAESHQGRPTAGQFDCAGWIAAHNLEVNSLKDWHGGRLWVLRLCPWNPEQYRSAHIVQFPGGAISAGCFHDSCQGKDWHALRDLIEPGWRIHSAVYKDEASAERKITFETAAELAAQAPERVQWIVYPWVAQETITLVEGKIKSAGKTTFVTHLVAAVLDGAPFMGHPTTKTPVVYLTEQPRASFLAALAKAHLLERKDLTLLRWHNVIAEPWPVVAHAAIETCKQLGVNLLVVDTGPQWARLVGDTENNSGDALRAMQPLQEAVAAGITVIVVWHERKGGGDVCDAGRGSSAVGRVVDIILAIRRPGGNLPPTVRAIQARSRFDETPEELMVDLTEKGYVALGKPHEVKARKAEQDILAAAPKTEGSAISTEALLKATKTHRTTGQKVIKALCEAGKLGRLGKGKKGDPYKFWRPHSAPTPNTDGQNESSEVVSEVL
jgi:hypothetical protein